MGTNAADGAPPRSEGRILVTGGAGFIGSNLAVGLAARRPGWELVALDNLRRRGSELNLPRLREAGVRFLHGDIRSLDDVLAAGEFDAIIECSAEPSVLAGGDYLLTVKGNQPTLETLVHAQVPAPGALFLTR